MCRKAVVLVCVALLLGAAGAARSAVFSDNFETAHNYLVDGVVGTSWDGFLGAGAGETASALNASTGRPGQLFLESTGAYWHEPWTPLGPFLYKVVEGDFVATVKVTEYAGTAATPVYHNTAGLMARAFPEDAGNGEDWVSLDYFPIWNCGNFVRSADDNVRTENGHNGLAFNLRPWLQIEKRGNTFHFRTSADGVTWTAMAQSPLTRNDLADVRLQIGVFQGTYNTTSGFAAFDEFKVEGPRVIPGMKAYDPKPGDKATDVLKNVVLSWIPSETAKSHDVYFGTVSADVAAADRTKPLGLAVAKAQDANSYDAGVLAFGQTYFWRVDDVQADGVTINRGDVWSFTVEPYAYPITAITATASSQHNADMGPGKTLDGSGLDAENRHGVDSKTMWSSLKTGAQPTWIQYAFDRILKVDHMLVWNSNQALESVLGIGAKDVTIEYSTDGNAWTELGDFEFAQAAGDLLAPETIDLGGIVAKYVKLTIQTNWGGLLTQYGLSEVRFFYVPASAREPQPAAEATGVNPQMTLSWRAGREAVSHKVSLSTDQQAVLAGTAPAATVAEPQYEASLDLAQSYYWKVAEVNDAAVPPVWESDVWTFSTAEFIVVDDFEGYTDDMAGGGAIFQTWTDGWDDPANGSVVGYSEAPFAERTTVSSGRQSMPLAYDNSSGAVYSEAKRTFAAAQDWSKHSIQTLVVNFHGVATNGAAPLYVKINDIKVVYNAGQAVTALPLWKQWNIDLAATGANLKSVKSLTIGVGDGKAGGAGTVFIDDVRLYRAAPQVVAPADPGAGAIVANYKMDGNVQDSSGRNNHGKVMGDALYDNGLPGRGQALIFNGTNSYVDLPIGSLISSLSDMTVSVFANFSNSGGGWQRIFDFGSGEGASPYMFLCPRTGTTGPMRFAIRTATVAEQVVNAPMTLPSDWHHVAVAIDSATMTVRLYLDGTMVASGATTVLPKDLGNTTQNWLGRSQYAGDAYYTGLLDDFCIYNRALSEAEIRYLAGDR